MRARIAGRTFFIVAALAATGLSTLSWATAPPEVQLLPFDVPGDEWCKVRDNWIDNVLATHAGGTWATMEFRPTDEDLALLGLPSSEFLLTHDFPDPTMVTQDGTMTVIDRSAFEGKMSASASPTSFGGIGCMGIRPGAWLLLLDGGSIGWCSMAHVYGTAGAYSISTAGHCGKVGDTATVIAALGNHAGVLAPILLDFGSFSKSTGDAGIGKDWALIGIDSVNQPLVSPTMCVWGGPIGMYTKTGATVSAALLTGNNIIQGPFVNPDPLLIQGVVHYGHGTGVGAGGTPRAGTTFHWGTSTMIWEGVISPGDSGSGSNTAGGDTIGAQREAAGINTHIFVDVTLKTGIGFMASTRATLVQGTLANGQLVPYPVPAPGLP